MKKSVIIGIVVVIIVLVIAGIFFVMYAGKECKTDTDCLTKNCFTAECKNNKCEYSPIADCCGNDRCEVGETYKDCVIDCPNCDDINNCTLDSYDYHEQKCVNKPILNVICCGNDVCEIGENYENCTRDCPNCDDKNNCTTDSYDYNEQKCINEIIIPCCGNGICDESAETYENCLTDCPNCDDNDKSTTDIFNYETQKCEYIVDYFTDDFEDGNLDEWKHIWRENPEDDWDIISENGNKVVKGHGGVDMHRGSKSWTDYTFTGKLKLIKGCVGMWVRATGSGRYEFRICVDDIFLNIEEYNIGSTELSEKSLYSPLNKWHDFKIVVKGINLKFYLNDKLIIDADDKKNTFPKGWVGVKSHSNSEVYFDDFKVEGTQQGF
ncbi:MAG: DUF1080 domain-containing protein [Nanoarchaeota archaeon]|nr:DUF1080 domain-containing protein [Nanoarchaeota archaeon]